MKKYSNAIIIAAIIINVYEYLLNALRGLFLESMIHLFIAMFIYILFLGHKDYLHE